MNKPVKKYRIGLMTASIWRNEGKEGHYFSVSFERSYEKDGAWNTTQSYGQHHLLALAKLADLSHTWILAATERAKSKASLDSVPPEQHQIDPPLENNIPF